jgi:hypothetical protein
VTSLTWVGIGSQHDPDFMVRVPVALRIDIMIHAKTDEDALIPTKISREAQSRTDREAQHAEMHT